jgi:allantoicase
VNDIITVFQNPTHDNIQISINNNEGIQRIQLYSLDGKLLIDKKINIKTKINIDLSEFAQGVYILECYAEKNATRIKVVKY